MDLKRYFVVEELSQVFHCGVWDKNLQYCRSRNEERVFRWSVCDARKLDLAFSVDIWGSTEAT